MNRNNGVPRLQVDRVSDLYARLDGHVAIPHIGGLRHRDERRAAKAGDFRVRLTASGAT
jgi:hypothetical protein